MRGRAAQAFSYVLFGCLQAAAQEAEQPLTAPQARLIEMNAYLLVAAQKCGYEMRVDFLRRVYRDAGLNGRNPA